MDQIRPYNITITIREEEKSDLLRGIAFNERGEFEHYKEQKRVEHCQNYQMNLEEIAVIQNALLSIRSKREKAYAKEQERMRR